MACKSLGTRKVRIKILVLTAVYFRGLINQAGYRFVKTERGRAMIASRQSASVDLLEYLRYTAR